MFNRSYNDYFNYDRDWLRKYEIIKKDPYRYILPEKEVTKCEHRAKRAAFFLGIPALYVYKNFRYHQELSRVKKLNFSAIQLIQVAPKTIGMIIVLYAFSFPFFVDYDKLKMHTIAKIEIQKFDPEWFNYDEFKYTIHNAPAYQTEDSVFGRLYLRRLPYEFHQTAGWIRRLRDQKPNILNEVPPKYDFTPKGPRAGTDFKALENKPLPFLIDTNCV